MSQWNNSYAYNNQYQGANTWNGDINGQYANQGYYPNRQYDPPNQYVNFNEFLNQMQSNNATTVPAANYNNYEVQYNYQNMPSTSQNTQGAYYGGNMSNGAESYNQSQYNSAPQQTDHNSYTNEVLLKSNLTPTATEFVPKSSIVQPSTSVQSIPEASSSSTSEHISEPKKIQSSSSSNWRERPKANHQNEPNHRAESANNRDNYRQNDNKNRNREGNSRDRRSQDQSNRYESNGQDSRNRNDRNQSRSNAKMKNKESADAGRTFYNSSIKENPEGRNGKEGSGRKSWAGSQRVRATERNMTEDEQYANSYLHFKEEKLERNNKAEKPNGSLTNKNTNQGK